MCPNSNIYIIIYTHTHMYTYTCLYVYNRVHRNYTYSSTSVLSHVWLGQIALLQLEVPQGMMNILLQASGCIGWSELSHTWCLPACSALLWDASGLIPVQKKHGCKKCLIIILTFGDMMGYGIKMESTRAVPLAAGLQQERIPSNTLPTDQQSIM